MKKIIIIDDEPLARSIVVEFLEKHTDIQILAECSNGFEGVKAITQHQPDLIFLDIQMPKINGFEMLELLPTLPAVIFTTAFDEYAIKAFENNAIDYLLKPFSQDRFNAAMEKWKKNLNTNNNNIQQFIQEGSRQPEEKNRIVVKNGTDIRIIPTEDIIYIEAYDDYVKIFTKDSYYLKKKTMNYYEEVLEKNTFFRAHRSFIINLQQLSKIESLEKNSYIAILKNNKRIPLSRSSYSKLRELWKL
jgi:two-component system LytT family response regulator